MFQEWAVAAGIPPKPLYRAAEVAKVLGISRSTTYRVFHDAFFPVFPMEN